MRPVEFAVLFLIVLMTPALAELQGPRLEEIAAPLGPAANLQALSAESGPGRKSLALANTSWVIPATASVQGQFGAHFKTKVVILNPTASAFPIYATLYNGSGKVKTAVLQVSARSTVCWNDFLSEALGYTGAGAVWFDSSVAPPGGSPTYKFIVTAEVYTDSPNGRYKTFVNNGKNWKQARPEYSLTNHGINVSVAERTNIGVFNASTAAKNTVTAEIYNASGIKVDTVTFEMLPNTWEQRAVAVPVVNGMIKWSVTGGAYLYAVTVDNQSNDGSLTPAVEYFPF